MANNDPFRLLKLLDTVYAIKLEIIIILITSLYNNYPEPGVCKARTYTLDLCLLLNCNNRTVNNKNGCIYDIYKKIVS